MNRSIAIAGLSVLFLCAINVSSKIVDFNNIDEMTLAAYHVGYAEIVGMNQTHVDLNVSKILTGSLPVGRLSVLLNLQWEQGIGCPSCFDSAKLGIGDKVIVFVISKEIPNDRQYEVARGSHRRVTWAQYTEERWKRVQDILSQKVEPVPYAQENANWLRQLANQ